MGRDMVASVLTDMPSTDKDMLDDFGLSPLMVASQMGHLSTVKKLLNAGADVNILPDHGNSALHWAAQEGRVKVIRAILEHGADVNLSGPNGWTALHVGFAMNQADAVGVLLDAGADVDRECGNRTPLIDAIIHGASVQSVHTLLRRGCRVSGSMGQTPLHWACLLKAPGFDAIVDLLLRWGLSESILDDDGNTPAALLGVAVAANSPRAAREVERASALLANAPVDRAWRRRSWLVMLRARTEREKDTHSVNSGGSSSSATEAAGQMMVRNRDGGGGNKVPRTRTAGGGSGDAGTEGTNSELQVVGSWAAEGGLGGLVAMLFDVPTESDGVLRTVVGYL